MAYLTRHWPRWLCALLGHEPVEWGRPERDEFRCLCGRRSETGIWLAIHRGSRLDSTWRQRTAVRLWRWLP